MSKPVVIITRAEPGASETMARVRQMGFRAISSPALSLELVDPLPEIPTDDAAGLLFTSANGARFFADVSTIRHLPAWCVGPATATAAQEDGFEKVHNADGNSADLASLVIMSATPRDGHLIHIANTAAGDSLRSELVQAGFDVRIVGLYRPVEAKHLSHKAKDALQNSQSICVLIHSAKGASSFAKLYAPHNRIQITFICVSDKAAMPVSHLGSVKVANRPNEESLLQTLQDWQLAL